MTQCPDGPTTDQFDMLTPLVNWVEEGQAPVVVIASACANAWLLCRRLRGHHGQPRSHQHAIGDLKRPRTPIITNRSGAASDAAVVQGMALQRGPTACSTQRWPCWSVTNPLARSRPWLLAAKWRASAGASGVGASSSDVLTKRSAATGGADSRSARAGGASRFSCRSCETL